MLNSKKLFASVIMAGLAIFTFACSTVASDVRPADVAVNQQATSSDPDSFFQRIEAEYKHRQEVQKEFLSAASWLAEKTDDAEAREISNLLNDNVVTYMTIGPKIVSFDHSNKKRPIPLLIVEGMSLMISPTLKQLITRWMV